MESSYWDTLHEVQDSEPILLYGTGNGADKILDLFAQRGIRVSGVFASEGFVRNRYFRGMKVLSYREALESFGPGFTVVLAFGSSLPDVMDRIRDVGARHRLIIPDLPLYGGEIFDLPYFDSHCDSIRGIRELLADDLSKEILDDLIRFRLTGSLECLSKTEPFAASVGSLLSVRRYGAVLDGGAFTGDTSAVLAEILHPEVIMCAEPDPHSYFRLLKRLSGLAVPGYMTFNRALWDDDTLLPYNSSGSRGSGNSGANRRSRAVSVRTVTLDTLSGFKAPDLIKLDIEGAEMAALRGGADTLSRVQPDLIVSLYHRTDDIIDIPSFVHSVLPGHSLYLRRVPCFPFWDLNLFAIKNG